MVVAERPGPGEDAGPILWQELFGRLRSPTVCTGLVEALRSSGHGTPKSTLPERGDGVIDTFIAKHPEPWARRLLLPSYSLTEGARYSGTNVDTVQYWYYHGGTLGPALAGKLHDKPLSYLELIELAMVAAFRRFDVPLQTIRRARNYAQQILEEEYPFATERWKTDGTHLILTLHEYEPDADASHLIVADSAGQLAWKQLIADRFMDFDYVNGLVLVWHPAGRSSNITIDPRVAFGAPTITGIPTWAIRGRARAGETIPEIAEDFKISPDAIEEALAFERSPIAA